MDAGATHSIGRMLIGLGVALVLVGALVVFAGRIGFPIGRLPGDIALRGKNFSFYAPLATCLLLSLAVSLLLWLINFFRR